MKKKDFIILGIAGITAIGFVLLGRYQRKAFRRTIEQMREDFLNFDDYDEEDE